VERHLLPGQRTPTVNSSLKLKRQIRFLGEAIRKVYPDYPSEARVARVEGNVVVEAAVSKTGEVTSIKSVSGPPALTQASAEAAKGWKFTATSERGTPVEVLMRITFKYDLGLDKNKHTTNEQKIQR